MNLKPTCIKNVNSFEEKEQKVKTRDDMKRVNMHLKTVFVMTPCHIRGYESIYATPKHTLPYITQPTDIGSDE